VKKTKAEEVVAADEEEPEVGNLGEVGEQDEDADWHDPEGGAIRDLCRVDTSIPER
jgi:hypothetical protein